MEVTQAGLGGSTGVLGPQCLIKGTCVVRGFQLGYKYAQLFYIGLCLMPLWGHTLDQNPSSVTPSSTPNTTYAMLEKMAMFSPALSTLLNGCINKKASGHACHVLPHPATEQEYFHPNLRPLPGHRPNTVCF